MKSIAAFRHEDYGLFIDLADKPASVAVHRPTGDILLDEGDGDDRFHGAALSARSFRGFELRELSSGRFAVEVQFGRNRTHHLGETTDQPAALRWIDEATRTIEAAKHLEGDPADQTTRPPVSLAELGRRPRRDLSADDVRQRLWSGSPRQRDRRNRIRGWLDQRVPAFTDDEKEEFARLLATVYNFTGPTGEELSPEDFERLRVAFVQARSGFQMLFDLFAFDRLPGASRVFEELQSLHRTYLPELHSHDESTARNDPA